MVFRKTIFSLLCTLAFLISKGQSLAQVQFSAGSKLLYFTFATDQGVLVRMSEDGNIVEWGKEVKADRAEFYAPRLQPFMGRIEYYGPETADSAYKGKIKNIGTCFFTYYGAAENKARAGKVKSIGSVQLDYFNSYDNAALQGKIKMAGTLQIDYFNSFEEEALRGKLKSIGSTAITYYSVFDDRLVQGKVKTIGPISYSWYGAKDRRDFQGALKSGAIRQIVNGITYIIQ